jgi:hypothetical protein
VLPVAIEQNQPSWRIPEAKPIKPGKSIGTNRGLLHSVALLLLSASYLHSAWETSASAGQQILTQEEGEEVMG